MPKIAKSPAARADLLNIYLYVGRTDRSPSGADRLLEAIEKASALYAEQPLLGTPRPEFAENYRLFSCGTKSNPNGWVVIYRPIENGIELMRVYRASQNYTEFF
ncbi:MAG: hypothetical protein COA78_23805 [Blastopirellula sp.]|nr:MAG: hypothetical protein COA78_23805 [Blastopirellula sp.]